MPMSMSMSMSAKTAVWRSVRPTVSFHTRRWSRSFSRTGLSTVPLGRRTGSSIRFRRFSVATRLNLIFPFPSPVEARYLRDPVVGAGMSEMLDLNRKLRLQTRLPSTVVLVNAIGRFFAEIAAGSAPVEDLRAGYLLNAVRTVVADWKQRSEEADGVDEPFRDIPLPVIQIALAGLARRPTGPAWFHREVALELVGYADAQDGRSTATLAHSLDSTTAHNLVRILCQADDMGTATSLARSRRQVDESDETLAMWLTVGHHLSRLRQDEDVARFMDELTHVWGPVTVETADQLLGLVETDEMLERVFLAELSEPDRATLSPSALRAAVRIKSWKSADAIVRSIDVAAIQTLNLADAVLEFKAATAKDPAELTELVDQLSRSVRPGLGPDTVNRMVTASVRADNWTVGRHIPAIARAAQIRPDEATFALLGHAALTVNKDPETALSLLREAVRAEDGEDESTLSPHISGLLDRLIVAYASRATNTPTDPADVSVLLGLVEDLGMRKTRFSADAAAALIRFHFSRDEVFDVIDLVRTHAFAYSINDRLSLRDVLVAIAADDSIPLGRAWDAFTVLEESFGSEAGIGELNLTVGAAIVDQFCRRKRADMACLVFDRLAHLARLAAVPTAIGGSLVGLPLKAEDRVDGYIGLFTGIALATDPAALDFAFNQLKVDPVVCPTTQLLNSVMLAQAACTVSPTSQPVDDDDDGYARAEDPGSGLGPHRGTRALSMFVQIEHRLEGVSRSSVLIGLWACEQLGKAAGEDLPAHTASAVSTAIRIWKKIVRLVAEGSEGEWSTGAVVDDDKSVKDHDSVGFWEEQVLAGFVAVLGSTGQIEMAKRLMERQDRPLGASGDGAEHEVVPVLPGGRVSSGVVAGLVNGVMDADEQRRLLGWIAARFPVQLADLKDKLVECEDGRTVFEVKRVLRP